VNARLTDIGRDLQSRLRKLFDTSLDADATPLEICEAVLEDVEHHVQPVGRGRRVFPYTRLLVSVHQTGPDPVPIESAFERFDGRVRERLSELRCEAPAALDVRVTCVDHLPADWPSDQLFRVEYVRSNQAIAIAVQERQEVPAAAQPALNVTVLRGSSTEERYRFTDPVVSIGRSSDPSDDLGRIRRNRVAFVDTVDGVTETVGRAHALLRYDTAACEYRLFDEGSSNGTAIIRGGTTIVVPARDPRGVRLRSGDEVMVGRAVLRVEIGGDNGARGEEHTRRHEGTEHHGGSQRGPRVAKQLGARGPGLYGGKLLVSDNSGLGPRDARRE